MKVGYRRVSTLEQSLDRQDLGECDRVFEEKQSVGSTNRPALQELLSFVRSGDEVVVHSIDRLARNLIDLQNIIQEWNDKGVTIIRCVILWVLIWPMMPFRTRRRS